MKTPMLSTVLALAVVVGTAEPAGAADAPPDRSAPPKPGPVRPFTITKPVELKAKNGMRVLFVERKRAPLVDVVATTPAGIMVDPAELPGLATWTASMLTEGAGDLDSIAFSDAEQSLGAEIEASADQENAQVTLHVSSSRFAEAMKLYALALTKPRFDDREWQRVRQQHFGNFMYQAQEPQELVSLAGARANWGAGHRFGVNLDGTPRALVKAKTSDMRALHAAWYRPDTTTLIVVGDIDKKTLQKVVDDTLGAWTAAGPTPVAPKLAGPQKIERRSVLTVDVPGAPQTVLRVQNPAPADIQLWTPDVEVMNTLLGGSFTSRLNTNLREEHGYSYGAGSRLGLFSIGNVFVVRTAVATPTTALAVGEIVSELKRIQEPATEDEVVRARNLAALSTPSAFDSGQNTAGLWAEAVERKVDFDRLQRFMEEATKVDVKAVQRAAKRVVSPEACTIVAVGDMAEVGKGLEGFGPRTTLTVEDLLPGLEEAAKALGGEGGAGE
jgi:zinc protease